MRRRNFLGALTALPFMPQVIDPHIRVTRIHDSIILDIETWTPGESITWPPGLTPLQIGTHIHNQIEVMLFQMEGRLERSPTGRLPTKPPLQRLPPRTEMGRRFYEKA